MRIRGWSGIGGVACLALLGVVACVACAPAGVLEDYVTRPDTAFTWRLDRTQPGFGYTGYVLTLVSQQWRSAAEVDRPEWTHRLYIAVPSNRTCDQALLYIDGGDNDDPLPSAFPADIGALAWLSGAVAAAIEMVPNQPLYFTDESRGRWEDAIIAYSWDKAMTHGDPNWIAQLPMTKAAVRAMDVVEAFLAESAQGAIALDGFIVAGASKRGWTAWLTAAVDERVTAVMPLVIDLLNTRASFRHHYAAYGFFAPAVQDYEEMSIFARLNDPAADWLLAMVDPLQYADRLDMPKYLINSACDEFFLPDSWRFYYDQLPGPKRLRYVPNTGHSLANSDAMDSVIALGLAQLRGAAVPDYAWEVLDVDRLRVTTDQTPQEVRLWTVTNPVARDFRWETLLDLGTAWQEVPLSAGPDGAYEAALTEPASGYRAHFVELTFAGPFGRPYAFTTGVYVRPDALPFVCDYDMDGIVDIADVRWFAESWLAPEPDWVDVWPTAQGDGRVDLYDLRVLSETFLNASEPSP